MTGCIIRKGSILIVLSIFRATSAIISLFHDVASRRKEMDVDVPIDVCHVTSVARRMGSRARADRKPRAEVEQYTSK